MSLPVLVISGSVGVGKTSVLIEIHDILSGANVPHGCIERDAIGYSWPVHGRFNEEMIERNLACVVKNFLAADAAYLLIAGVIENDSDLSVFRRCIPDAEIQICRLTASVKVRSDRLRSREKGAGLKWHLDRTVDLDTIQDAAGIESFCVDNGQRPLRDAALEVLDSAGWLLSGTGT